MPVLSGGLLGISRRWWDETGGRSPTKGRGATNTPTAPVIKLSLTCWLLETATLHVVTNCY